MENRTVTKNELIQFVMSLIDGDEITEWGEDILKRESKLVKKIKATYENNKI